MCRLSLFKLRRSLCLALAALVLPVCLAGSTAHAQLSGRVLLSNAVADYGPQYKDVDEAIKLFREGKLEEARKALTAAKTKNPQLAPVNVMLSHLLFSVGQAKPAVSLLESIVAKEPNDPEAYIMLADIALRQRRLGEAELMFGKGLAICAKYTQNKIRQQKLNNSGLAGLAAVAEARADWKLAATRLATWIKADPKNANAHTRLGLTQFRMKKTAEAKSSFTTARKLNDKLPLPQINLAQLHEQAGEQAQAEKLFGEAIKAAPSDLNTRLAVVQWALNAGKNDLAAANIKAARQIDANSLQVKLATGLAARFANNHKDAMTALEEALEQSPRNFAAMNHLALTLIDSTDEKERIRALGYAHLNAQINSNRKARASREATVTLSWILFRIGHADVAERVLKGILNAGPIGSESAYYAALILANRGQTETAGKILKSALRNKSQFPGRDEAERILGELAQIEQPKALANTKK